MKIAIETDFRTLMIVQSLTANVHTNNSIKPEHKAIKYLVMDADIEMIKKMRKQIDVSSNKAKSILKLKLKFQEAWALDKYLTIAINVAPISDLDKQVTKAFIMDLNQSIQ